MTNRRHSCLSILGTLGLSLVCSNVAMGTAAKADGTDEFLTAMRGLEAVYRNLSGKEVKLTGRIGTMVGEDFYFLHDDVPGMINVRLDTGRPGRKLVEDCSLLPVLMQESNKSGGCRVEISAEVEFDFDVRIYAGRPAMRLLVYELRRLDQ